MANRIAGITVEIGEDTTKLSTALKSVNQEIRSTQHQGRTLPAHPSENRNIYFLFRTKQNHLCSLYRLYFILQIFLEGVGVKSRFLGEIYKDIGDLVHSCLSFTYAYIKDMTAFCSVLGQKM